jgi:hypothetical protein
MADTDGEKLRRVRSPAYPALNLKIAIEKAYELYRAESRNPTAVPVALQHWGYSTKSGSGFKALAALKSFGLVEVTGSGDLQRVKLSDLALRIILDEREDSPERIKAVAAAALRPKIHRKLWNLWGAELPSHGNIRYHLIFVENFNEHFVDDFIKEYKASIDYADVKDVVQEPEQADAEQDEYQSRMPANPSTARRSAPPALLGRELGKFPVGRNCTITLLADGDVSRKGIEALVAQLKLNLELGVFDELPPQALDNNTDAT